MGYCLQDGRLKNKLLLHFDENLQIILEDPDFGLGKVWLAGGSITSTFTGAEINDYDLYFERKRDIEKLMPYLLKNSTINCVTDKSISFNISGQKYQIIYYSEFEMPHDIFKDFDFSINCGAYNFTDGMFYLDTRFENHIRERRVEYNCKTKYPILSAMRINKYEKKGFKFDYNTKLKIYTMIADLSLNSVEEFVEQIGGYYGANIDVERMKNELRDHSLESRINHFLIYVIQQEIRWNQRPDVIREKTGLEFNERNTDIEDLL